MHSTKDLPAAGFDMHEFASLDVHWGALVCTTLAAALLVLTTCRLVPCPTGQNV